MDDNALCVLEDTYFEKYKTSDPEIIYNYVQQQELDDNLKLTLIINILLRTFRCFYLPCCPNKKNDNSKLYRDICVCVFERLGKRTRLSTLLSEKKAKQSNKYMNILYKEFTAIEFPKR